jgi:hypothetical protein
VIVKPKIKTHFEQVPLRTIKKVIEEEIKREQAEEWTTAILKKSLEDALPAAKAQ